MSYKNQGSNWIRRSTRLALYHRDGFACVYCGAGAENKDVELGVDHVRPRELGGSNKPSNLVTCCDACNVDKDTKPLKQWLAELFLTCDIDDAALWAKVRRHTRRKLNRVKGRELAKGERNRRRPLPSKGVWC
jgi:hypothetical protein